MASQTYVDSAVKALRDELTEQLDKLQAMMCSDIPDMKEKMEQDLVDINEKFRDKLKELEDKIDELKATKGQIEFSILMD